MHKIHVTGIDPVMVFRLQGALVEVGLHALTWYDLDDTHCPLHSPDPALIGFAIRRHT